MTATFGAVREGAWRAVHSPVLLLWLWLVSVAVAAPATWLVARAIEQGIGRSGAARTLRDGFDMEWHARFAERARGLRATFTPERTGAGVLFDNLDDWLDGGLFGGPPAVTAVGAVHALLWLAMLGGVLDRFADRDARPGVGRFFRASGRLWFRLLRLALLSGLLYASVYRGRWSALEWVERAMVDVTMEGAAFVYHAGVTAAAAAALLAIHACFAFAKVATVVEGRRSALVAAWRGLRFVVVQPLRVAGLYAAYGTVAIALVALWVRLGPGIAQSDWGGVARAFAAGQLLLIAQLCARLWLIASQTALYQAYAGHDAAASMSRHQGSIGVGGSAL